MTAPPPVSFVILCGGFALALALGKAGGALAVWRRMPAVVGELAAGLAVAVLAAWWDAPAVLLRSPEIGLLAQLGLLLLLFEVGLHATVGDLFKVSGRATAVALIGVTASLALGTGAAALLMPEGELHAWLFTGAALAATSVAISVRVFAGRGEAALSVVLAAAVIDDLLALVMLAVAMAATGNGGATVGGILLAALKAVGFLGAALGLGVIFSRPLFAFVAKLRAEGLLLATALILCFSFALGARAAGLAPIIGAFAAGLILEPAHSAFFTARGERSLEDLLHPLSAVFAPVFFVCFGASIQVGLLLSHDTLLWGALLTAAALLGKLACVLAAPRHPADPWLVAFGMLPRGEVSLVYAAAASEIVGKAPLLPEAAIGGLVIMVLATAMLTPPLIAWRLNRVVSPAAHPDAG